MGGDGLGGVTDLDDGIAEGTEFSDEVFDAVPGGFLEIAGDSEGSKNDNEVGLDRCFFVVVERAAPEVSFGHPEGPFDLE